MKNKFKFGGLVALVGLLGLASTAFATPISFDFTTKDGSASFDTCGRNCNVLNTAGDLKIGGVIVGGFEGTMRLIGSNGLFQDAPSQVDESGSSWTFVDDSGLNSLFGSLSGDVANLFNFIGLGSLIYTVDNGTGLFANATGSGWSLFTFLGGDYSEAGHLDVDTTSVPEPGVSALLLAGLGMVGFMAWRRRYATTQL